MLQWLKHAFAVEPPGPVAPEGPAREVVERLCREVVRRRLTTPALILLESSRPLNFLTAQALHVLAPLISAVTDDRGHGHLAEYLEKRGSIDFLCRRIEELEAEATRRDHRTED